MLVKPVLDHLRLDSRYWLLLMASKADGLCLQRILNHNQVYFPKALSQSEKTTLSIYS